MLAAKLLYDAGVFTVYANNDTRVVQLLPPLVMADQDLDFIIPALDRALTSAKRLTRVVGLQRNIKSRLRSTGAKRAAR